MSVTTSSELEIKDPAAVLDYSLDWSDWLGADTIATSAWTVGAGLTKVSDDSAGPAATYTTVWVSGGVNGTAYSCANTITTAAGRTNKRTITITVGTRSL